MQVIRWGQCVYDDLNTHVTPVHSVYGRRNPSAKTCRELRSFRKTFNNRQFVSDARFRAGHRSPLCQPPLFLPWGPPIFLGTERDGGSGTQTQARETGRYRRRHRERSSDVCTLINCPSWSSWVTGFFDFWCVGIFGCATALFRSSVSLFFRLSPVMFRWR